MKPTPLDDALARDTFLSGLATRARRRRAALERADEEFAEGTHVADEADEAATVRLAAADRVEARYANDAVVVDLRDGLATLVRGPAGLALRGPGGTVPLAQAHPVSTGIEGLPATLSLVDARGRAVVLRRA